MAGMPPPAPRRKDDMRKQALSGLLAAVGPGQAGLTRSVLDASLSAAAQPHAPSGASSFALPTSELAASPCLPDWTQYWDERKTVDLPDRGGPFNVYCAGSKGPILLAVHGAGYTGLTWSLVAETLKDRYRVIAPDLRGHGLTKATPETDFSKQTLADDLVALWHAMFPEPPPPSQAPTAPAPAITDQPSTSPAPAGDPRATVLVGHSMGGAVAVWTAATRRIPSLAGCVVVDVVEGTALAALPHMMGVIAARPSHFPSPSAAVSWALRTGMSHCKAAAAISLPSQLIPAAEQPPAPAPAAILKQQPRGPNGTTGSESVVDVIHPSLLSDDAAIQEEEEEGEEEEPGGIGAGGESDVQDPVVFTGPAQPIDAAGHSNECTSTPLEHTQAHVAESTGNDTSGEGEAGPMAHGDTGQTHGSGTGGPSTCSADGGAHSGALGLGDGGVHGGASGGDGGWVWRTPLVATQPYWQDWYTALSDALLGLPLPKMLLLAGTDRLDKSLTIGQMQGKFQLVVLPKAGHAIQEDDAPATAAALDLFAQRQRVGAPPLALPRVIGLKPVLPVVAGPTLM